MTYVATGNPRGRPADEDRNAQIIERLQKWGETYAAIGKDFGVTRQRIEQIGRKNGVLPRRSTNHTHSAERSELLREYVDKATKPLYCVMCKEPQEMKSRVVCSRCLKALKVLRHLKSVLQYGRSSQALWTIRRYNIQPEDLEWV